MSQRRNPTTRIPGADLRHLRAEPRLVADRRTRLARGRREAVHEPRAEVPDAERDELPIGVDELGVALAEGPGGEDRLGEPDEGETPRDRDERAHLAQRHAREGEPRQARGHAADDGDAHRREVEPRDRGAPDDQGDQRTRNARREPAHQTEHDQQHDSEDDRAPVRVADVLDHLHEGAERAVGVDGQAEQRWQLADDDDHGDAVDEPEQDGPREEVGEEAEAEGAGEHEQGARQQREHPGEHREPGRSFRGQRRQRDHREDREPRLGPDHQPL